MLGAPAAGVLPISRTATRRPASSRNTRRSASYTLPWYGIRVAGTLQSIPGPALLAQNIYNNTNRPTATTLARPFTLAQANANLLSPGDGYGDRLNQIDFRFTKIVDVGKGRLDLNVDFYNAFNSDAVITRRLSAFGPASAARPRSSSRDS